MRSPTSAASTRRGRQAAERSDGAVHAWTVDLDALAGGSLRHLNAAERARARRYLSSADGARFAASRAALRLILGHYLGADPGVLRFGTGSDGRPALAAPVRGGLEFSLARSAGEALIAVSRGPVGADLEQLVPRCGLPDLAAARFSSAEAACIASGCAGSPLAGFYRHWTAKEAYLKSAGIGLAGLADTELSCGTRDEIRFRGRPAGRCLSVLEISTGLAGAVVADGPVSECQPFTD